MNRQQINNDGCVGTPLCPHSGVDGAADGFGIRHIDNAGPCSVFNAAVRTLRRTSAAFLAVIVLFAINAVPAHAADKKITIGVMPKLIGIDYFNATEKGAKLAGTELGVTVDFNGPTQPDVTQQAQMVETWITKKYDAIAIAPNDPDAISIALGKARKRGIKVLTWDTDAQPASRDWFVNQCSSESIVHTLVDIMAEGAGKDAKYLMLIGTLTASNQNTWLRLANAYAKEKFPQMTNLSETPKGSEEDQALATQVTIDSLKAYPQMNGLFALTSVALPGAAEGLRKAGAASKVFLTGLSTPKTMREYVKDGTVKKFALWNPEDLGYLAVYAAVASVKGELKPGAARFKGGHVPENKITGSEILLGDPLVFDKDNIDKFDF